MLPIAQIMVALHIAMMNEWCGELLWSSGIYQNDLKQQSCDVAGTCKEWAIMKYPEESWIPNSNVAREWGDLNFGG